MNPETVKYSHSTVDLHALIAKGEGDGQEADDLRDGMDGPCRDVSDRDRRIVGAISVLLYNLDGQDPDTEKFKERIKDDIEKALVLIEGPKSGGVRAAAGT